MIDTPGHRSLRRHQTITLSLLFLAGIVNFLDRSSLSIANTTVRAEMHLNATQMGWLLSAFSFAYGFAQLPLIGLLDRVGTRFVLGAGLTLWSAAQMLTGLVRSLPTFLILRVLLGIGEAPFYPSGIRSTREWFSSATRGRATAVMSSSQTVGLAIAPPILTWIMLHRLARHVHPSRSLRPHRGRRLDRLSPRPPRHSLRRTRNTLYQPSHFDRSDDVAQREKPASLPPKPPLQPHLPPLPKPHGEPSSASAPSGA